MAKEKEKILIDGILHWEIEEQTIIKHLVLEDYIDIWIKMVAKYNEAAIFDCYGGIGAYLGKNKERYFGSPILICKKIKENKEKHGRVINFYIIEKIQENAENLLKILKRENLDSYCQVINDDFNSVAEELINNKTTKGNLFFIDPFGYKIDFKIIRDIMHLPRTEIILNFMFNSINRWLSVPSVSETLDNMFNCSEWRKFRKLKGPEREEAITNLYTSQCKEISSYVYPFKLRFYDKKRTYYYLYHLTNYSKGLSIMKSSFAKFNEGKVEYLGKPEDQLTIFDLEPDSNEEVYDYIYDIYKDESLSYNSLIAQIIDSTPYRECEVKTVLKQMECEKFITVQRKTSIKDGIQGDDLITFKQRE